MKILILDNVRSVYNVGSMFRTANALGIETIFLCGITPTPLDKKGNPRKDFAKVALGAEDIVKWEFFDTTLSGIAEAKKRGCFLIAIEQDERAVDYKGIDIKDKEDIAFIIGSEVDGLPREALDMVDVIAEIPMNGTKESLNVTIAFGVAAYRILGV